MSRAREPAPQERQSCWTKQDEIYLKDQHFAVQARPRCPLWSALLIHQVNPATIIIEGAPDYLTSSAGYMLRLFLERAGYFVQGAVLDPTLYAEITGRKRTVIVATSEPGFQWPAKTPCTKNFGDIADSPELTEPKYFTADEKPWLFNHWETQTKKGNGFAPPQLTNKSTRVNQCSTPSILDPRQ